MLLLQAALCEGSLHCIARQPSVAALNVKLASAAVGVPCAQDPGECLPVLLL
jgi:hypothetical protein